MITASHLLLSKIAEVVSDKISSKSNNKGSIKNIVFDIDCIIVYLTNCHIKIKYSEIIDSK